MEFFYIKMGPHLPMHNFKNTDRLANFIINTQLIFCTSPDSLSADMARLQVAVIVFVAMIVVASSYRQERWILRKALPRAHAVAKNFKDAVVQRAVGMLFPIFI